MKKELTSTTSDSVILKEIEWVKREITRKYKDASKLWNSTYAEKHKQDMWYLEHIEKKVNKLQRQITLDGNRKDPLGGHKNEAIELINNMYYYLK